MTNESWIPAPSRPTPMATTENLPPIRNHRTFKTYPMATSERSKNKIVDCDHCDREHLAPPPPPPFYSSFAIPLIRNHRRPLQQWIRDNNQWRRITRCQKQWWGPSIEH